MEINSKILLKDRKIIESQINELNKLFKDKDKELVKVWSAEIGRGIGFEFTAGRANYKINNLYIGLSIEGKTALLGDCYRLKANGEVNKNYSSTSKITTLAEE